MRVHPRQQIVEEASSELRFYAGKLAQKYGLSDAEYLMVVGDALSNVVTGLAKQQIRIERHGDTDTPGGRE